MKSIMEEASSIIKAIEKGWTNRRQPKEFTIKIFEEPQKNFIGMTTKPAKLHLFFLKLRISNGIPNATSRNLLQQEKSVSSHDRRRRTTQQRDQRDERR